MTNARHPMVQRLTAREELFVLRVFEGQPLIAAYRSAYSHSGLKESQIQGKAETILTKEHIRLRLKEHRDRAAAAAGVDVAMVINELVGLAFVDPTRIVRTKILCCRHCHGFDGKYQWVDKYEFDAAKHNYTIAHNLWHEVKNKGGNPIGPEPVAPSDEGGYEFKKHLEPNPHCDNCHGAGGDEVVIMSNTDKLTPIERRAIAGYKKTKYGVTVELRDRSVPLKMIADHLGMFVKKVEVTNPDGSLNAKVPPQIASMKDEELSTLKQLLLKALVSNDNSVTDVQAKRTPDSNNIPGIDQ